MNKPVTEILAGLLCLVLLAGCENHNSGPTTPEVSKDPYEYLRFDIWDIGNQIGQLEQSNSNGALGDDIKALRSQLNFISERKLPPEQARIQLADLYTSLTHTNESAASIRRKKAESVLRRIEDDLTNLKVAGFGGEHPAEFANLYSEFEVLLAKYYEKQYEVVTRDAQELSSKTAALLKDVQAAL